jgi:hypothetical protein
MLLVESRGNVYEIMTEGSAMSGKVALRITAKRSNDDLSYRLDYCSREERRKIYGSTDTKWKKGLIKHRTSLIGQILNSSTGRTFVAP